MIADEPNAGTWPGRLDADRVRLCTALSVWETMAGLCRAYAFQVVDARVHVGRFLEAGRFAFAAIAEREYEIAADAWARFGKGRHPAGLNMGDCYAYACARANRAKLLFKGNDFSGTDTEPA